jgi:hypothetical protein
MSLGVFLAGVLRVAMPFPNGLARSAESPTNVAPSVWDLSEPPQTDDYDGSGDNRGNRSRSTGRDCQCGMSVGARSLRIEADHHGVSYSVSMSPGELQVVLGRCIATLVRAAALVRVNRPVNEGDFIFTSVNDATL